MHPNAPLAHMQHHRAAVAAVMRNKDGMPKASEGALKAARDAGLIRFTNSTGAGVWQLTAIGSDLMTDY
jgi:hypothetical protein